MNGYTLISDPETTHRERRTWVADLAEWEQPHDIEHAVAVAMFNDTSTDDRRDWSLDYTLQIVRKVLSHYAENDKGT